jgi:hypothetical protein
VEILKKDIALLDDKSSEGSHNSSGPFHHHALVVLQRILSEFREQIYEILLRDNHVMKIEERTLTLLKPDGNKV